MIRAVYRGLLWLHPPAFQERFADEMVWIFDLNPGATSRMALLLDGVVSLGRQWLLRTGLWKFAVGLLVNATLIVCSVALPQRSHCRPDPAVALHASSDRMNRAKPAHPTAGAVRSARY